MAWAIPRTALPFFPRDSVWMWFQITQIFLGSANHFFRGRRVGRATTSVAVLQSGTRSILIL